jgi:hypothetical protein
MQNLKSKIKGFKKPNKFIGHMENKNMLRSARRAAAKLSLVQSHPILIVGSI